MGKDILHIWVGNGGHCGCETVSREVLPQVEIPEKWTQEPPCFAITIWCAIKIAHQWMVWLGRCGACVQICTNLTQIVPVLKPAYSGITRWKPWLLLLIKIRHSWGRFILIIRVIILLRRHLVRNYPHPPQHTNTCEITSVHSSSRN